MDLQEPRTAAIAIRNEPGRVWAVSFWQGASAIFSKIGAWASNTAQTFGSLVSALMGPAVVSAYALAAWSLAANLGWTDSFVFGAGPLSNWIVWFVLAVAVHGSAEVLKRHTQPGK
jgi:hypothetical protein